MPQRLKLVLAFAAVYLLWGSTYLAIRIAIETVPPFLMAGVRHLTAGVALYVWMRLRKTPRPSLLQWASAAVVGGLMLLGGNGGVTWAEQRVPSGVAAVLVATVPLWIALMDWWQRRTKPRVSVIVSLALGLLGIVLLVGPEDLVGGGQIDLVGAGVLVLAAILWAAGSLYSRRAGVDSTLLSTGMEMVAGGSLLLLASLVTGQASAFDVSRVSLSSVLALGYLIVFGSLLGFTSYIWLLRSVAPSAASTYAYVNPVVAVFLGWALGGEPLTARTLVSAAIIVGAVVITTLQPRAHNH